MKMSLLTKIILAIVLCFYVHTIEAGENSAATVHLDMNTSTTSIDNHRDPSIDEIFDVDIVINGAVNLNTFNLVIQYPDSILELQDAGVTEGNFLDKNGADTFFTKSTSTSGKVEVTCVVLGTITDEQAADGDGILAHLRFKALSTEYGELTFSSSDTQLLRANNNDIDDPVALGNDNGGTVGINCPTDFGTDSANFSGVPYLHAQSGSSNTYIGQDTYSGYSYTQSFSEEMYLGVKCLRADETSIPSEQQSITILAAKDVNDDLWLFKFVVDGDVKFSASTLSDIINFDEVEFHVRYRMMTGNWDIGTIVTEPSGDKTEVISKTATLPQYPGEEFVKVKWTSSNGLDIDYEYFHETVGMVLCIWDDSDDPYGDGWMLEGFESTVTLPTVGFSSSSSSGDEGINPIVLPVTLSEAFSATVTVNYSVTSGIATGGGVDYTLVSGTLEFEPGDKLENIYISGVDDSLDENSETIVVTLSNPVNANLGTSVHTYTILDNDPAPSVEFPLSSSAGSEAVSLPTLAVELSGPSGKTITVGYSVTGGTAVGGGIDYTLVSGTLTFVPGDTSENISIPIVNDSSGEANETIIVTLSSPVNASIGSNVSHTYTIENDDPTSVAFAESGSNDLESESSVSITVGLLPALPSQTVTVDYIVSGTATAGVDYSLASGTLTFDPGQTSKDISLSIIDDSIHEENETIIITLSNPVNATIGTYSSYTYTIIDDDDETEPTIYGYIPDPNSEQVSLDTIIQLHFTDEMTSINSGIDSNTVEIIIEGEVVYDGSSAGSDGVYVSSLGKCKCNGTEADYTFTFTPSTLFNYEQKVDVSVYAEDKTGNKASDVYYFYTAMRTFGENARVNSDTDSLVQDNPDTVMDSSGNIYVVWDQTTAEDGKDIYIGKLGINDSSFGESFAIYSVPDIQSHPVIAIDSSDTLYVTWQQVDPNGGYSDIYISSSSDGNTWSTPVIVDFDDSDNESNQMYPDIAIDYDTTDTLYITCDDGRAGNRDIWISSSTNGIAWTPLQITTNTSDQIEPAVTINNHAVIVGWTDYRNGSTDIYGATSENSWNIEVVVVTSSNQSGITFTVDPVLEDVHEFWVDDAGGYNDIYFGQGSIPLVGSSIIDEPNTHQSQPSVAFGSSKIFACWTDWRNVVSNNDTDIYFAESGSPFGTNILVNDDYGTSSQSSPVVNVDIHGNPYIVWVDDRNGDKDIYYAGTTYISDPLPTTITTINDIITIQADNDILVSIPAGGVPVGFDANDIIISELDNLPELPEGVFGICYNIRPSGLMFSEPVTITIPHAASDCPAIPIFVAFWYNPETGTWSQEGITNVQHHEVSSTIHTVSFQTTHFTVYGVGTTSAYSGGGGGGGCTMSQYPSGSKSICGYFMPYVIYVLILLSASWIYKRKSLNK